MVVLNHLLSCCLPYLGRKEKITVQYKSLDFAGVTASTEEMRGLTRVLVILVLLCMVWSYCLLRRLCVVSGCIVLAVKVLDLVYLFSVLESPS